MEITIIILSGLLVSLLSGLIGKAIGSYGAVDRGTCSERQTSCRALIMEKLDNLTDTVAKIEQMISFKN